jgi:hypothetical protein
MKLNLTKSLALLFIGTLLGAGLVASMDAGQEEGPTKSYAFWNKVTDPFKSGYLMGYLDAEKIDRIIVDEEVKPVCGDAGKAWIEAFDRKNPVMAENTARRQVKERVDEFYKDPKNQRVPVPLAIQVVELQTAGRPQAEIDEATKKARAVSNE